MVAVVDSNLEEDYT